MNKLNFVLFEGHDDLLRVATKMRARDWHEQTCARQEAVTAEYLASVYGKSELKWVLGHDEPIAAFGASERHPGVWTTWMFMTDRWREVVVPACVFIKKIVKPLFLAQPGVSRVQCRALEDKDVSHRFYEWFGFRKGPLLERHGRDGENFRLYEIEVR